MVLACMLQRDNASAATNTHPPPPCSPFLRRVPGACVTKVACLLCIPSCKQLLK